MVKKIQKFQNITKITLKKSLILEEKKFSAKTNKQTKHCLCFSILGLRDSTRALQSSPILRKKIWKNLILKKEKNHPKKKRK